MSYHSIVGAVCVYNGEQFLEKTLESVISKIKDLNAIHILDGAWENSGYSEINSTDTTEEIIQRIDTKYGEDIQIIYVKADHVWHNPSDKRNAQLKMIDSIFEEHTVFWFDDDEEIRFRSGIEEIWVRDFCRQLTRPAIVDTYAYNSHYEMRTPRFIPGGLGIHWHTERSMCLHDSNCNMLVEWTPEQSVVFGQFLIFTEMFLVNMWPKRYSETLQKRKVFSEYETKEMEKLQPCQIRCV